MASNNLNRHSYRENGRFAPNPRAGGGLVNAAFDARQMVELTKRVTGEAAKITAATKDAHVELAKELQKDIAKVLADKVAARGRVQGMARRGRGGRKSENDRLGTAIKSPRNRRVSVTGYTVGYLDEIPEVAPYYRNLETGTSVFVGRYLSGVFLPGGLGPAKPTRRHGGGSQRSVPRMVEGGRAGRFTQSPKNGPRGFNYERPYNPGVRIKNPIIGYRYFEGGMRRFESRGGTTTLATSAYIAAFNAHKLPLLARALGGQIPVPDVGRYDDGT